MLLQRRLSLPGSTDDRTTKPTRMLCPGGSEGFHDRNLQAKDKVSSSSSSGIEDLSDLKQGFKVRDIVVTTGQFTGVTPDQMLSDRREPIWVEARHIVFFLASELTGYSYPKIGHILSRDHTTVIYGKNKVKERLKTDPDLRDLVGRIVDYLNGKK